MATLLLSCPPAFAHIISNPSIPKPAIEATVELEWPTEFDERPARLDETRFSTELALARFGSRPRLQFDIPSVDGNASSQPFFVGAAFGEGGLFGFRFNDFGPYGQEFVRSEWQEEAFDGFSPLADAFAGFGRSGQFGGQAGANGNSASASSSSAAAASNGTGSSGNNGVNLMDGAYNPFNYQHLFRGGSFGSGGGSDGSSSELSSLSESSGDEPVLPIGMFGIFPWGPFGLPIGITPRPGLGPANAGLFPFTAPPLYAGCGYCCGYCCGDPYGPSFPGVPSPILGFPFGVFNPIIGPIGPFGFPFPHLPHHHCPPCIPEPSQLAMLLTLVPGLGLVYRARFARRRKTGLSAK